MILAEFAGSFALYAFSALAGRHDDETVISLTRLPVNTPHSAMQSERRALSQKTEVFETSSSVTGDCDLQR